jgi:hypothetical protein
MTITAMIDFSSIDVPVAGKKAKGLSVDKRRHVDAVSAIGERT